MHDVVRIGARIGSADPYWVQLREAVLQRSQQMELELVSIDLGSTMSLSADEQLTQVEELLAYNLDALICSYLPEEVTVALLQHGMPVIQLTEAELRHPLFASPRGYYEIALMAGRFLAKRIGGRGRVLLVGGLMAPRGEDGRSRIAGFYELISAYPRIASQHIPSAWRYEHAYGQIELAMRNLGGQIDAIFGLSDSLALAARDAGRVLGMVDQRTVIIGINGDPLALAAVADGSMAATVDTPAAEFALQAVDLAFAAACRRELPDHFSYRPQLVTAANVAEIALRKLSAIAELPSRLVGVNRQQEQERLTQLELSRAINRRAGAILDRRQLSREIAELIRNGYGYDMVQLYLWHADEEALLLEAPTALPDRPPDRAGEQRTKLELEDAGILGEAVRRNELLCITDTQHNHRFAPDPAWPATRSRVVVPVRFGGAILGLLDLHSRKIIRQTHVSLSNLQLLADELGIAMRNADLYSDALQARARAEQADLLKSRLLANVSHELRTPLNVILGYSQAALATPNPYETTLPSALLDDLRHIYRSGEHLIRLINDLLDLSCAEVGELELWPETVDPHTLLEQVFAEMRETADPHSSLDFRLTLPERLPLIRADPVRLRQILLNLLANAIKFTTAGEITLGAEPAPPNLHVWVSDTGAGIPEDQQERIFEPFVAERHGTARSQGVGLGLSITRRLVALHGGTLTVQSRVGSGSTFHLRLPLPCLDGPVPREQAAGRPVILLIAAHAAAPPPLLELARRQDLAIHYLHLGDDLTALLERGSPAAVAWNLDGAEPADRLLLGKLRADPRVAGAPLLVYGSNRADLNIGATGLLSKPVHERAMLDALEAVRNVEGIGPVLIADDDASTREVHARLVAQALPGAPIRLVDSGAAALEQLEREVPSLVLLDLGMPDVDGFAVLEQLRADTRTQQVPVLVLSGRTLEAADIARIDHALVTFHSKDMLTPEEAATALESALTHATALAQPTSRIVKQVIAYLQQHYAREISREEIAAAVGVSKNYLTQIFRREVGLSPWEFLNRYRVLRAKALLRGAHASITDVASKVGFEDASYFGRVFRKYVGCSPHEYRDHLAAP